MTGWLRAEEGTGDGAHVAGSRDCTGTGVAAPPVGAGTGVASPRAGTATGVAAPALLGTLETAAGAAAAARPDGGLGVGTGERPAGRAVG